MSTAEATGVLWKEHEGALKAFYFDERGEEREVAWAPQPGSQTAFLSCPIYEVLYEGNRGPGKTDALLMSFGQHCGVGFGPDWRGVLFRQTYKQLDDIVSKTKKWFPRIWPQASFNEQKMTWRWPTGEELLLRHMSSPDDYYNYHGHAYPWIGWEELTTWADDKCYKLMMSCSRSTRPDMPRMYRSTTNPYGVGHNWVKTRFKLRTLTGSQILHTLVKTDGMPDRIAIRGYLKENRILMHSDPQYLSKIKAAARNAAELAAWIDGSWDIVAGGMFDDIWTPAVHVIPPFEVPKSWKIDRSFDWGSSRPFSVGFWAESDGSDVVIDGQSRSTRRGDLFRIDEIYGWNGQPNEGRRLTPPEIAREILKYQEVRFPGRRVWPGPADSSIYDKIHNESIADEMMSAGIMWYKADKTPGSRVQGWEKMRTLLKASLQENREDPGMFITSNCEHFLRTIPVLPRDEKNMDDVDTDAEDHVADEARYRVLLKSQQMGVKPIQGR